VRSFSKSILSLGAAAHTASAFSFRYCTFFRTSRCSKVLATSRATDRTQGDAHGTGQARAVHRGSNNSFRRKRVVSISGQNCVATNSEARPLWCCCYYNNRSESKYQDSPHSNSARLARLQWIHCGYKAAKEFDDGRGRRRFKRSMASKLVVDMRWNSLTRSTNSAVFRDGDFRALVQALKRQWVTRSCVCPQWHVAKPPSSQTTLRQADVFIDLDELREIRREEPGGPPVFSVSSN